MVADRSMVPSFQPGDRLLVERWNVRSPPPTPGEVIVLHDPEVEGRLLLKRVAKVTTGPPELHGGPRFHVEVRGDALDESRDSRAFGPVPGDRLVGRAWYRYAPEARRGDTD
ncbi:MAG: S26 family signal peptidase [Euryarchaeota archaeon]|nr:S26 family signal peptidase [Euryarchaeota archaeon]MDE1880012.1 S26 family signal peptidase [Euryarchaeota archaeon]